MIDCNVLGTVLILKMLEMFVWFVLSEFDADQMYLTTKTTRDWRWTDRLTPDWFDQTTQTEFLRKSRQLFPLGDHLLDALSSSWAVREQRSHYVVETCDRRMMCAGADSQS